MVEIKPEQVSKKSYVKPALTEVRLVPEEAVLGACKDGVSNIFICVLVCDTAAGS
jgi:hypothetical protein